MTTQQSQLNIELENMIKNSLPGIDLSFPKPERTDEEEDTLISKQSEPSQPQTQPQSSPPPQQEPEIKDVIDPLQELIKNNDVVPLLAVIDKMDLDLVVDGKPLLSRLCTMHIPLFHVLSGRDISFKKDDDNRTALHEAIAADDIAAAFWCLQHKVGNFKDNFGNTPILEAIRLGRRSCFLLCLHYQYYDPQAPHVCAVYNRSWEIKVLHRMGYDVLSQKDSEHFSPLERAVENYSYDVAEFISQISSNVAVQELQSKTDSKGIIRLIKRVRKEISATNQVLLPLFFLIANIFIMLLASSTSFYSAQQGNIRKSLGLIVMLYAWLYLLGCLSSESHSSKHPDILQLLVAPQFPPLQDICPHCLVFQNPAKEHCRRCNNCVTKLHFHQVVCVNGRNQIFWFFIQICWGWFVWNMHYVFVNALKVEYLQILNFSSNWFFGNAAIIDLLITKQQYVLLLFFVYLKIFLAYQFCSIFQWLYMLTLKRTYREVNNSQRYKKLYKISRAADGNYKSLQIRLMERGLLLGIPRGLKNIALYLFD